MNMPVNFVLLHLFDREMIWVEGHGFHWLCSSAGARLFKAWILNLYLVISINQTNSIIH